MNTTPLTEKDMKCLRGQTSKVTRFGIGIVMPLFSLIAAVAGVLNLFYCSRYAELAHMSMAEVIRIWFTDIEITANYSGILLKALERWEMAIFDFVAASVVGAMCVMGWRRRGLYGRVLKFIDEKNIPL